MKEKTIVSQEDRNTLEILIRKYGSDVIHHVLMEIAKKVMYEHEL